MLDRYDTSYKYYIQLLGVRGIMYDRIHKVLQQVTATWVNADYDGWETLVVR